MLRTQRAPASGDSESILVEIYVGSGCHLCEQAISVLERVQREIPFRLAIHQVESRADWERAYRSELPVVFIDGIKAFKFRIEPSELVRRLRRRRVRARPRPRE